MTTPPPGRTFPDQTVLDVPWLELGAVATALLALTLATTWPLAARFRWALASDLGDPLLNTWILAWGAGRLLHGFHGLWDAPIFFPYSGTLAYSETLLGILPLSAPVTWLTGNPVAAYNAAFVLSFVIAGTGMYLLARSISGRPDAAALAALAYAFSPYRALQLPHLQVLMCGWLPIALWALHRGVATGSWRAFGCLTAAFLLQALSNGYLLYFSLVPLVLVAGGELMAARGRRGRILVGLAAAAVAAGAVLAPVAAAYSRVHREQGFVRSAAEIEGFSATPSAYVRASNRLLLWGPYLGSRADTEVMLFPGAAVAALALASLAAWRRRPRASAGRPRRLDIIIYSLVGLTAFVLSLGPRPRIGGRVILQHGPYAWLLALVPGLDGLRVPARIGLLVILALAVLAAIGAASLLSRLKPGWHRSGVVVTLGALIVAEGYAGRLPTPSFHPLGRPVDRSVWQWLASHPPGAILALPGDVDEYTESVLRQQYGTLVHRRPLVNGFSGYQPPLLGLLTGPYAHPFTTLEGLPAALDLLRAIGARYIVVSQNEYRDHNTGLAMVEALLAQPTTRVVHQATFGHTWIFELRPDAAPARMEERDLRLVPPSAFTAAASHESERLALAFDGDLETRWLSRQPQSGQEWIALEFESPRNVGGVQLVLGERSFFDYPRELVIECDDEKLGLRELYRGVPLKEFGLGLLRSAIFPSIDVHLPDNHARTLRLRQVGHARTPYWSIHELRIWER